MARENAAEKGRRYLTEGRVIVTSCTPGRASATCRGDGVVYELGYEAGTWRCSCPVRTDACAHLHALRLITAPDLAGVGS